MTNCQHKKLRWADYSTHYTCLKCGKQFHIKTLQERRFNLETGEYEYVKGSYLKGDDYFVVC